MKNDGSLSDMPQLCQCEGDTGHGSPGHCWEVAVGHVPRPNRDFQYTGEDSKQRNVTIHSVNLCLRCATHYRKRGYTVKKGLAKEEGIPGYQLVGG